MAKRDCLVDRLIESLTGFVRAKKLFAYKEQSKTEPVALDVLVMSLARAYLLTILNGIAGRGHSRTVPVSEISFVVGEALLDLPYEEDHRAEADFNIVMTDAGEFVEVQGTAEEHPFTRSQLDELLGLAEKGIGELFGFQRSAI